MGKRARRNGAHFQNLGTFLSDTPIQGGCTDSVRKCPIGVHIIITERQRAVCLPSVLRGNLTATHLKSVSDVVFDVVNIISLVLYYYV